MNTHEYIDTDEWAFVPYKSITDEIDTWLWKNVAALDWVVRKRQECWYIAFREAEAAMLFRLKFGV